ncbi:transposable element Tcb2 transposase [Trichonephila clavipes]|nr:transposable element Tcb2 transposase [Trichonephila clavipes]
MDSAYQVGTEQEHGGSIIVWGVFSWHGLVSFVCVPTSLNAIQYLELLGYQLRLFTLFCYPHGNGVFQQDNCTSHKSRRPDLNPIEYLGGVLEQDVKGHHTAPTNLTELWTALANIWQVIPTERFQKLVESMTSRVAAVIKAG